MSSPKNTTNTHYYFIKKIKKNIKTKQKKQASFPKQSKHQHASCRSSWQNGMLSFTSLFYTFSPFILDLSISHNCLRINVSTRVVSLTSASNLEHWTSCNKEHCISLVQATNMMVAAPRMTPQQAYADKSHVISLQLQADEHTLPLFFAHLAWSLIILHTRCLKY